MCEEHTQPLLRGMPPQFSQTFCTACTQYEIRLLTSCQGSVNKEMSVWTGTNRSCEQMSFIFFILDVLSLKEKGNSKVKSLYEQMIDAQGIYIKQVSKAWGIFKMWIINYSVELLLGDSSLKVVVFSCPGKLNRLPHQPRRRWRGEAPPIRRSLLWKLPDLPGWTWRWLWGSLLGWVWWQWICQD